MQKITKKNVNIKLASEKDCTGCSACATICPSNSISMHADNDGFLQPCIDSKTCIACHRCENTCPVINQKPVGSTFETISYVARCNQDGVLEHSTSGGVFYSLAEWVIRKKGVVFGARFNEQWELVHDYTETMEGLDPFMRSKYVQSRLGETFNQAKQFLQEGRMVLFVGTPCQVGGLKSYLSREYENLLLVDFVCHGVPSPKIWKQYLEEKCNVSTVSRVNFRDKQNGWDGLYEMRIDCGDNTYKSNSETDEYLFGFLNNYFLRNCCYFCKFKNGSRYSDLTIADAWGVEEYLPEMYNSNGTSLVLIHTLRGKDMFFNISKQLISQQVELGSALEFNRRATTSVPYTNYRPFFFKVTKLISVKGAIRVIVWLRKIKKHFYTCKRLIK